MAVPDVLSEKDVKGVGKVSGLRVPISAFLLGVYDVPFKDLFMRVNQSSVLNPAQFFLVNLINLRTHVSIVQVYPVNLVLLDQLYHFFQ